LDIGDLVRQHYSGEDLASGILSALSAAGQDVGSVTVGDLAAVDQLHAGGPAATRYLFEQLGLGRGTRLLDVGSGIGGPARLAAAEFGSSVVGVDLSPDFVTAAARLSSIVGLSSVTEFLVGSGADTGLPDASFDRASLIHVGMNIPDKAAVFAEVHRVLATGGIFGVYEQMRVGPGDLTYPLPWAADERSSFVSGPDEYIRDLTATGFTVVRQENRLAAMAGGGPPAPGLDQAAVFGPVFAERIGNNLAAARAGLLAPILLLAVAE
jgi:SAM-dependent methyltransferase